MAKIKTAKPLIDGLCFPESPRWHKGKLYFVDMYQGQIYAVDFGHGIATSHQDKVHKKLFLEWHNFVSGLGWLPNGDLLFVDMQDQKVMRRDQLGNIFVHADLSHISHGLCNDMVVDPNGDAYVSSFGYDIQSGEAFRKTPLIFVSRFGSARACSPELAFPNGMVINQELNQVVVAETAARRLVSFQRAADGSLHNRQSLVRLGDGWPDGICLDEENCIWVALVHVREVVRVNQSGKIIDRIATSGQPIACMLGGDDNATLFITTAPHGAPEVNGVENFYRTEQAGCIEVFKVSIGRYGFP